MATVNGDLVDAISTKAEASKGRFVTYSGQSVEMGGSVVVTYLMMQPDSGAPSGYLKWTNTTGDAQGRPAPTGVLGDMMVVTTWIQ